MCIASAGMPGPFHLSSRGCRILEVPGIPPGLFDAVEYEMRTIHVEPGDSVLFCTDGITDAFNTEEESFGIARVQEVCEADSYDAPAALLVRLFAELESFTRGREQHDDMTAAAFHCESPR
jgi:sigma-B regulation protein RsbU (phosphoserine phosphatase)